ncbi:hypothetical protein CROQUDRAFT_667641 [Cronartium quercuum f. sp. fusiforme G11]|uniref:Uncharacterized protein n=1 Tax=Cronartium quercuum f. sp. fusiforme G11 TaxID=708437 RepID=A0A9P6NUQ2_9BASI|nr:hypothetical protein CROQUDRAFT_667641 [Cronartium quercuum f. sp. fusiforme G11]
MSVSWFLRFLVFLVFKQALSIPILKPTTTLVTESSNQSPQSTSNSALSAGQIFPLEKSSTDSCKFDSNSPSCQGRSKGHH